MEIGTYLRAILRYWWLVLLVTLIAGGTVTLLDKMKKPSYSSHARVLVQPATVISDTRTLSDILGQMGARYVINTLAQSFTSADVKAEALQAASLSPVEAAKYPLEANVLPDTTVIDVSGTGPDAMVLASYINSTINAAVKRAPSIFQVIELVPMESAAVPDAPSSPTPMRDIPLGAGFGLALGILLALTIEYLRTPKTPQIVTVQPFTPLAGPVVRDDRVLPSASGQEYLGNGYDPNPGYLLPQDPRRALQPGQRGNQPRK